LLEREDEDADEDVRHGVQALLELGGDAEVAAAAAERPEQILVLALARAQHGAVGGHHLGGEEVVDAEAGAAGQIADAAAEGEAADAGRRDDAAGRGQAMRVGGVVEDAPGATATRPRGARPGVDLHVLEQREVDHGATIIGAETRGAVATAADRDVAAGFAGKAEGRDDVIAVHGADDARGALVVHAVV